MYFQDMALTPRIDRVKWMNGVGSLDYLGLLMIVTSLSFSNEMKNGLEKVLHLQENDYDNNAAISYSFLLLTTKTGCFDIKFPLSY